MQTVRAAGTDAAKKTRGSGRIGRLRYRYRLALVMSAVALPIMLLLALLLSAHAAQTLTEQAGLRSEEGGRAVAIRVDEWLADRRADLTVVAARAGSGLDPKTLADLMAQADKTYGAYDLLQVSDLNGVVIANSRPVDPFGSPKDQDWFRTAAGGQQVTTTVYERNGHLEWVIAQAVMGADGRPTGVAAGYLDLTDLSRLLTPQGGAASSVVVVDANRQLVYDTVMGKADGAAMLQQGSLRTRIENIATQRASSSRSGSVQYTDRFGKDVVGGFATTSAVPWIILEKTATTVVLEPARNQFRFGLLMAGLGALITLVVALIFGGREADKLRAVANDSRAAGVSVNSSAAQLSASSEQMAATTTQQNAAVTEASATTEELARASAAIADTVDEVARQTGRVPGQPGAAPSPTSRRRASGPCRWPPGSTTSTCC